MTTAHDQRDPLDLVAAEFTDRCRRGERPSVEEYARANPRLADDIRELFPTIEALERQKTGHADHGPAGTPPPHVTLQRLGDFRVIRELGRGGMGIVYEAEQESLGRRVAIKVLPRQVLLDANQLRRFEQEARTAARLHHTNIVPIFGVGEHEGYHYIVMQYIRGVGLDAVIRELRRAARGFGSRGANGPGEPRTAGGSSRLDALSVARGLLERSSSAASAAAGRPATDSLSETATAADVRLLDEIDNPAAYSWHAVARPLAGRLPGTYWRSIARIALQSAEALEYAHQQGTLHRDIKPGNLILDADGTVWVADFGVAKAVDQQGPTRSGDVVGTLRYMAPEQFNGNADARSDVYSLGLTLYELATLEPAFAESSVSALVQAITHGRIRPPRELRPNMPRDLETIVLKATALDAGDRYASAAALAEDLRRWLNDLPPLARRASTVERLWRWSRRNPVIAGLGTLALLLLLTVAVVSSTAYWQTRQANLAVKRSLEREELERRRAEALSGVAIETIDTIFDEFAPRSSQQISTFALADENDDEEYLASGPVLSHETAALLEHMLEFYERLAAQQSEDDALRLKIADANRRVGDIHQRLGRFQDARGAYGQALALLETIAADPLDDTAVHLEIARVCNELGNTLIAEDMPREAYAHFGRALSELREPAADADAAADVRFEYARTLYLVARGPWAGSLSGLAGPVGPPRFRSRGGSGADDGPRRPRQEPPPGGGLDGPPPGEPPPDAPPGEQPRGRGEREGRPRDWLRRAIEILDDLTRTHGGVPEYRHLLALCYVEMARMVDRSDPEAALAYDSQAIAALEALTADAPDVPAYQQDLCRALASPPRTWRRPTPQDISAYEGRLQRALSIAESLAARHANEPAHASLLAAILTRQADLLRRAERDGDAELVLLRASGIQSALVSRFPDVVPYRAALALTQLMLARHFRSQDCLEHARDALEIAVAQLDAAALGRVQRRDLSGLRYRCEQMLEEIRRELESRTPERSEPQP